MNLNFHLLLEKVRSLYHIAAEKVKERLLQRNRWNPVLTSWNTNNPHTPFFDNKVGDLLWVRLGQGKAQKNYYDVYTRYIDISY